MTLRLTAPAIFVAALLLLPFLNKPFTIDDPLFLREAKHALVDPLHPADFEQVWNAGDRQKLSQYLLGGTLPAYVLAPVAALGGREWVAHLYQFLLLSGFLVASVSVARRLGCDRRQANTAGLLIASNPVTLAMAATCMPDVMAMMFGMAGIDRLLLFREEPRWGVGLASGLLLAAAMLCRASTAPLLLVAALVLMPTTWKRAAECLWPLGIAAVVAAVFISLNRGPAVHATVGAALQSLTSIRNVPRNLVAFLCYQALTGPLLIYALLSNGRMFAGVVAGLVALGVGLSMLTVSANLVLYAVPASLGICFVLACVITAGSIRHALPGIRGGELRLPVLPLLVWLGCGMVALPYVHMAAKYLLPGVPAAALLIVLHGDRVRQQRYPLTVALLVALGWISGALIVVGDTTLASLPARGRGTTDCAADSPRHAGGRAGSGPFSRTRKMRAPRRWPIRPHCPNPATPLWSAAWTTTECWSVCPSTANCSTRGRTGAAECLCSTASSVPDSIPSVSATCHSLSGVAKSTHTTSTVFLPCHSFSGVSFAVPFDILMKRWHPLFGCLMNQRPAYFRARWT